MGAADRSEESRDQVIRAAADTIKSSRGEVHAVRVAAERMVERYDELLNTRVPAREIARWLENEADAIATEATVACAEIGSAWTELLVGDVITLLVHGDSGPLACGMVGMFTSGVRALVERGAQVHVWVTEGSPSGEGARVAALQLTQLDIAHTVIPDSAVGWLLFSRRVNAAVLRGDTIASNGETVALLGASMIAQLAHDSGVPVHVLAPDVSWARTSHDVSDLVLDIRSAAELGSANRARLNPPFDVVPARNVTSFVSERSVVSPPFKEPR